MNATTKTKKAGEIRVGDVVRLFSNPWIAVDHVATFENGWVDISGVVTDGTFVGRRMAYIQNPNDEMTVAVVD